MQETQETKPIMPTSFKMGQQEYYNSKDLLAYKPEFYYGCTSKPRNIITKKNIPKDEYAYATFEKLTKKWNPTDESCKKAQLLISKQWVDKFYFKLETTETTETVTPNPIQSQQFTIPTPPPPPQSDDRIDKDEDENGHGEDEEDLNEEEEGQQEQQQQQDQEIENAPPLLHLDDSEKFHDADGNIIEIETRGERHEDKIYFNVKDVSVGFEMPYLNDVLTHKKKGYRLNIDYKYMFNRSTAINGRHEPIKKCLFLTYEGILRVLMTSRNKNATLFRKWATNKLFTIQMGTRDQKVKLGAEVLNTSPRTLKAIFDKHASTFPSIYLMTLGKVRDVRETFGIPADKPDDSTVYKFGFSEDLARRVVELESEYSKLPGVTMQIATFQIIDAKYTSEAENEVRDTCSAFEVRVKKTTQGFNELIVLDDKQFTNLKKLYRRIGDEFAGATLGLQKQIKEYETELMRLKLEMQYKDDLHKKDIEYYKKDIELKETVIENWKLKYQLATSTFSSPKPEHLERDFGMMTC